MFPFVQSRIIQLGCWLLYTVPLVGYAQPAGQKDMFPLSVGNQWTFLHRCEYAELLLDFARFDTGTAQFTVNGSIEAKDSTRWLLRQTRIFKRHFYFSPIQDSIIHDTLDFEIVELNRDFHPMYRRGTFDSLWDSEFPFFADIPESTMIHRYCPANAPDTLTHSFVEGGWATFYCSLKKDTGECAEQLIVSIVGTIYSTNHLLTNVLLTIVQEPHAPQLPADVTLAQNYPNPFNPTTTIKYGLPTSSEVRLSVFDMLGREVSVLVNERMDAGVHDVKFDASGLASGIYLYRLQAGTYVQTRKLALVR